MLSAYTMPADAESVTSLRMVIRPHINLNVVDMLADDIVKATKWLDEFGGNASRQRCTSRKRPPRPSAERTSQEIVPMFTWFANTLRDHPEIAIFLALAIGYFVGKFTFKGIGLGAVTSTLLAAVIIGQLGITVSPHVKSTFFLIFLFAVGYGVGPQFVRGIASDGLPQAAFAVIVCIFCLLVPVVIALIAGYDLGSAAGLYAGSQTISASMGLATDAINRLGQPAEQTEAMLNAMPIAYAVTYIFGTAGSEVILALLGPRLLGIGLVAACKDYETRHGRRRARRPRGRPGTATSSALTA